APIVPAGRSVIHSAVVTRPVPRTKPAHVINPPDTNVSDTASDSSRPDLATGCSLRAPPHGPLSLVELERDTDRLDQGVDELVTTRDGGGVELPLPHQ